MRSLPLLSLISLLALQAVGKETHPKLEVTAFGHKLQGVHYFEDSDVVLVTDADNGTTYRSEDGGAKWKPLPTVDGAHIMEVLKHPYDKKTAVILGTERKHWITHDRGESWTSFVSEQMPSRSIPGIAFHATNPKHMMFLAQTCLIGSLCDDWVYYTVDGFETKPKPLPEGVLSCMWAKSTEIFTTGDEDLDENRILCLARGKYSLLSSSNRVVISDDFFETIPDEPVMSNGQRIEGVTNIATATKYMAFAAKGTRSTEMAMYVSDDTKTWHRAEFGEHRLEEGAYTILESTNYSMQVDVLTAMPYNPLGVLLTSNSNGTFFTKNIEHTNRNMEGFVDFEKVSNIQGIVLANTVQNWEDVERKMRTEKRIVTQISFDDGRTWQNLKAGDDRLHLHSVTEQRNIGRIFSSPAPGIVMGNGNTGKYLSSYEKADLYVSDDAGLTWTRALAKPHLYEFGAQGSILVAVAQGETSRVKWSLNHGKTWEKWDIGEKIMPVTLTTTPDSTSLKFILIATKEQGSKQQDVVYALDFDGLHEKECGSKDFEKWPARVDEKGEPLCIMGHVQYFMRRKADADCVAVSKDFDDPEESRKSCECTEQDFECDYNFKHSNGTCARDGPIVAPEGACEGSKTTFMGTSGYRLIPGNDCKGGIDLAKEVERECSDTSAPPASGEISFETTTFPGSNFDEHYYLERGTAEGDDETIVMRTDRHELWQTHDHGKQWQQILKNEDVVAIYPHQYINDRVYFITPSTTVHYSHNRLRTISTFEVKSEPNQERVQVLSFHPKEHDWMIWTGSKDCKSGGQGCETIAQISTNSGEEWRSLLRGVRKCLFVYNEERRDSNDLVYCEQFEDQDPSKPMLLLSSTNEFKNKKELKRDVLSFATMAEYIVVAIRDEKRESLKVDASIDGVSFADAQFPHNFNVPHEQAYTVLDSSTHAIFLHVTVNNNRDQEYGSILKSNSNGTSYVLSVSEVNRSPSGYVDFEKMQGLEGVAIINRVANVKETDKGALKKLRTYITHNDGAGWALLGRPEDPPRDMKPYPCSTEKIEKCSLHLHGYTERKDPRDTYSSPTAIGMMLGTGNVGEFLGDRKDADTFITTDGGINWRFAAEGSWMWEYGDMGSIIVIVKEDEPTDFIRYSLDAGKSWRQQSFGQEMVVQDLTTVPSDTSRNFLLWGKIGSKIATINIDFSGLKERSKQCKLDEENPDSDDYELWSPKHPMIDDDCLFGHVSTYHRKVPESKCYNGKALQSQLQHLHNIAKNCSCTREDYECDWNYEPDGTGQCKLVEGLEKPDPKTVCAKNPDLKEYNEVTGYRRIPLSTCQGGDEKDKRLKTFPCPNHEDEYKKKHGIGGAGLFFAIVIPIAVATSIGYWVWKNWDDKFGRIRLGDGFGGASGSNSYGGAFDGNAPWVRYPVLFVSGVAAVLATIPMLVGGLWRSVRARMGRGGGGAGSYARPYTSRSSFQRASRGSYGVVDPDEGELFGDESDEET